MKKMYRVLGKRGRITIPYEIRQSVGFSCDDVISFEQQDQDTVLVRRKKSVITAQMGRMTGRQNGRLLIF